MALQIKLLDLNDDTKPKYSIDSSVILDMWKGNRGLYPKDVHTGLWSHICELIDQGRIIAHREVYKELVRHDNDEFQKWLEANKDKFVVNSPASNIATRDIINGFYSKFKYGYMPSKKGGSAADPFVVGLAYAENCIVFTQEVPISEAQLFQSNEPAIPNVCKEHNIKYVRINDFLRKEGVVLAAQVLVAPEPKLIANPTEPQPQTMKQKTA